MACMETCMACVESCMASTERAVCLESYVENKAGKAGQPVWPASQNISANWPRLAMEATLACLWRWRVCGTPSWPACSWAELACSLTYADTCVLEPPHGLRVPAPRTLRAVGTKGLP